MNNDPIHGSPGARTTGRPKLWPLPLRSRELLYWQVMHPILRRRRPTGNGTVVAGPELAFAPGVAMQLSTSDAGHVGIAYCGFLELMLSRRISVLAGAGGVLVDVGANFGYFTCMWAARGDRNSVIAFEPAASTFEALARNVRENGLGDRVTLHRTALADEDGREMRFAESPGGQSGLSHLVLDGDQAAASPGDRVVQTATLDAVLAEALESAAQVNVLKIDAEGADALVLRGARQLLSGRRVKHVFFEHDAEHSRRLGLRGADARQLLQDSGYRVRRLGRFVWHAAAG